MVSLLPPGAAPFPVAKAEVKVNIDPADLAKAKQAFDVGDAEKREVAFFDTKDHVLLDRGLVLRWRVKGGDDEMSTVKIRPIAPDQTDADWFEADGFKAELEAGAGPQRTLSVSIDADQNAGEFAEVRTGDRKVKKLFDSAQRKMAESTGDVPWKKLGVLGPFDAKVWNVDVGGHEGALELWKLPKGKRLLELSVKCDAGEATAVRATLLGVLAGHGLSPATSSASKTQQAFEALG